MQLFTNLSFFGFYRILQAAVLSWSFYAVSDAQIPSKQWDRRFGVSGVQNDFFGQGQQTSDGGYILGGCNASGPGGDKTQVSQGLRDFWIIKTDASGNPQWDRRFGGTTYDEMTSLVQTTDGGYLLGGYFNSPAGGDVTQGAWTPNGLADYWIVKTDMNGNKMWDRRYGGFDNEYLFCVLQTSDGGYMLGGRSNSEAGGNKSTSSINNLQTSDYWIVKTDANGNKLWENTIGGDDYDDLREIRQTADGGYILAGYSMSPVSGNKTQASQGGLDYWIVKINSNGVVQWDKRYGGSSHDYLNAVRQTSDGGYVMGGYTMSGISGDKTESSQGLSDYWIVKADASGNMQWNKRFGGSGHDADVSSVNQCTDDGYILFGRSASGISGDKTQASQGGDDFWVVKTDASGNKQWDVRYGGAGNDRATSTNIGSSDNFAGIRGQQTSDGCYAVMGVSYSGSSGEKTQSNWDGGGTTYDFWMVRFCASALPVEQSFFRALPENHSVALEWQTLSEKNCDYFEIERSITLEDFTVIGIVKAAGSSMSPRHYEFIDREPYSDYSILSTHYSVPTAIYYRLKQVDYDGSYSWSETVKVNVSPDSYRGKEELMITGMSAHSSITEIRFSLPGTGEVSYEILDLTGNRVLSGSLGRMEAGYHAVEIGTGALPAGIYGLILTSGQESVSGRMMLY